jgi:hypothetical protein
MKYTDKRWWYEVNFKNSLHDIEFFEKNKLTFFKEIGIDFVRDTCSLVGSTLTENELEDFKSDVVAGVDIGKDSSLALLYFAAFMHVTEPSGSDMEIIDVDDIEILLQIITDCCRDKFPFTKEDRKNYRRKLGKIVAKYKKMEDNDKSILAFCVANFITCPYRDVAIILFQLLLFRECMQIGGEVVWFNSDVKDQLEDAIGDAIKNKNVDKLVELTNQQRQRIHDKYVQKYDWLEKEDPLIGRRPFR